MATKKKAAKKAAKKTTAKKAKHVYYFGAGKCDGDGSMKALLGGKGANLAEMADRTPRPGRFHHNHRSLHTLLRATVAEVAFRSLDAQIEAQHHYQGWRRPWASQVRRPREPSSPFRPLRCSRVDAWNDGHDSQPRHQRRRRRGPRSENRRIDEAFACDCLPPLPPDVWRSAVMGVEAESRASTTTLTKSFSIKLRLRPR